MRQFREVVNAGNFDVAIASLHAARLLAYPELDVAHYVEKIGRIATRAGEANVVGNSEIESAENLADFLYEDCGFRGNRLDYADPRNSYLNEVIDRSTGIPISLSIMYIAIAGKLGIVANGVGMPGHFLVLVGNSAPSPPIYIDCFNGVRLSLEDCMRLAVETTGYKGVFQHQWLEPASSAEILLRVLNNLRIGHMQNERWNSALACLDLIDVVKPGIDFVLRDKGLIAFGRNRYYEAAKHLDAYATAFPEATDISALKTALTVKLNKWASMN